MLWQAAAGQQNWKVQESILRTVSCLCWQPLGSLQVIQHVMSAFSCVIRQQLSHKAEVTSLQLNMKLLKRNIGTKQVIDLGSLLDTSKCSDMSTQVERSMRTWHLLPRRRGPGISLTQHCIDRTAWGKVMQGLFLLNISALSEILLDFLPAWR